MRVIYILKNAVIVLAAVGLVSCGGGRKTNNPPTTNNPPALSSNANLASLAISNGVLNPSFTPSNVNYATMFVGQSSITITPTVEQSNAIIVVNGNTVLSGQSSPTITLNPGANTISVAVTAQNGATTKTYTISASFLSQEAYIKPSITQRLLDFGYSLSLSGDTLAVGAPAENKNGDPINGGQSGAVYVFTRTGTSWSQQAYLKASNADVNAQFGGSVSLSGNMLAVGAPGESSGATGVNGDPTHSVAFSSGAVYVFTRTGTTWTQQDYIKASNTNAYDHFGRSVSLSSDTLAVGAEGEDSNATGVNGDQTNNSAGESGAAYVFTRAGTTWTQQAYIKASNPDTNDFFGDNVYLSGDTLAVVAIGEASNATGVNGDQTNNSASYSGAVYVFARTGAAWTQQAYIKASNTGAGDYFGNSISLSDDTLAVGAPSEGSNATGVNSDQSNNAASYSGAVYVFARTGTTWTQQAYIKASNTDPMDGFGLSVSLSGDTLAVGAFNESSNATGVNGNQTNNSSGVDSGAVYVFARIGTTWTQQAYIKASNTNANDHFGASVSLSGNTLVAGAYGEASNATGVNGDQSNNSSSENGAVYVLR